MRTFGTAFALVVGLLFTGATPAFAAKGVKKNASPDVVHGVVVSVVHHKETKKNTNTGEVTIKTKHSKKKGQPAAKGAKTSKHTHKFTLGKNTTYTSMHGKTSAPATAAALKAGEHVAITHKANHAESVVIHHKHAKKKKK